MKEIYSIDMSQTHYSKLLSDIPPVIIVITIGCNVNHREDCGLDDPSGKSDDEFKKVISIYNKI